MNTLKIDDLIKTQEYTAIASSYKWTDERCKNTFPASIWVKVLLDFLYRGHRIDALEKKYTKIMPKVNKTSNNMYINSLLRKVQLENKQNTSKIRSYFSEEELELWIVKRINQITDLYYEVAVLKAKKYISEWRDYYKQSYVSQKIRVSEDAMFQIKRAQSERIDVAWEKLNVEDSFKKIGLLEKSDEELNYENGEIEELGKRYFYDELSNKFGLNNVIHNGKKNKNQKQPYDFLVLKNGKRYYYEVKSTRRSTLKFKFGRNEYEFWKKCKENNDNYSLISIKNLVLSKFTNLPIIEEIENPQFEISLDGYGYKDGKILICPYKFIGQI